MSDAEIKPAPSNRKFYLLVAAFLLAAVVMGLLSARRGKSSVEQWKDELRTKGEKFTIAELLAGRKPSSTNRLGDLVRLGNALGTSSHGVSSLSHQELLTNGLALATWMRTNLGASIVTGRTSSARGHLPSSYGP